ncbi:DUF1772 domain-containing protein [Gordonia sp. GONU]|uniref:DUF1772 domain-containing protein n=1 Tax=Gordonia sp. GONU TaxID=2972949 RepID=UPI0021AC0338|nr:DUF1772 domain-containing protein [Gordonia sp. GONU]MCR8897091.1 DUF1772 domain-containing protein [Gordonia sp. GONU]
MTIELVATVVAVVALLATAVVYGTDVFCAVVMRPALAAVGDRALTSVIGRVHRYGDRRMPVPGVLGLVAAAVVAILATVATRWVQAVAAAAALVFLVAWTVIYTRVSAPINRRFTAAAEAGETPSDARVLQQNWDRVITVRATLQGLAVVGLSVALIG